MVFLMRFEFEFSLCLSLSLDLDMEIKELCEHIPNRESVYFCPKKYKKLMKCNLKIP